MIRGSRRKKAMSREQERSKLEERITVAEQKEKRYSDQMKILHREKTKV